MENHPIPQDVTGFQFKLIGNMTIKQFAYVAAGVILAVILYYLPFSTFLGTLVKVVFIPLLGGSGLIIAFLPIEGRPVDAMIINFINALLAPNQYLYHKTGRLFSFTNLSAAATSLKTQPTIKTTEQITKAAQLKQLMQVAPIPSQNKLDEKENAFLQALYANTPLPAPAANPVKPTPVANPVVDAPPLVAATSPALIQNQPVKPTIPIPTVMQPTTSSPNPSGIQSDPSAVSQPAPQSAKKTDLPPTPEDPNVIVGLVKDPRGNVLPNILVEVKDKNGNPVRAFKTNALGQFASATPLAPGNYTVEMEDPKKINSFKAIQLTVDNRILLPLEVRSHDAREELRQQLFSN
ncbi:MAG TPA: PrgI family protein [Patescibacteria group bacterium]